MNEAIQIILYMLVLIALAPILGNYMAKVFIGKRHMMIPVFGWLEKTIYRISGIRSDEEMNWKKYMYGLLYFNLFGMIILFLLQIFQAYYFSLQQLSMSSNMDFHGMQEFKLYLADSCKWLFTSVSSYMSE